MSEIKNICTQNENNDKTSALKSQIEEKLHAPTRGKNMKKRRENVSFPAATCGHL